MANVSGDKEFSAQRNAEESQHISNGFSSDFYRYNLLSYTTHGAFPDILPDEASKDFEHFETEKFAPAN